MAKLIIDINSNAPKWWRNVSRGFRYAAGTFIVSAPSSHLLSHYNVDAIVEVTGYLVLLFTTLDIVFGTKDSTKPEDTP